MLWIVLFKIEMCLLTLMFEKTLSHFLEKIYSLQSWLFKSILQKVINENSLDEE